MIDLCGRAGSPPSEVYQELFSNFSEIIWQGAHGICVDPVPIGKFAVEIIIRCSWAERNWLPVLRPEKYKNQIKFRNVMVKDGVHYIVPQYLGLPEIGSVISIGNTIEECIKEIEEICESIKGFYIETPCESLGKAQEEIEKFKSFGYDLFV
jgi:predicted RNase H-like HicB family nuclease